ncbi:MAG TPA: helix-turn-helix transcriptional regulator [Pseudomonadales bacterium]|nr:helix-turn-helix transcriptional regulator [Pseudomonadales bacterium]
MSIKPEECDLVAVFAANVKKRRLALKLSQEELAERAGVHRTYVGMLEREEKNVTIYNIERIARALGVAPFTLLK